MGTNVHGSVALVFIIFFFILHFFTFFISFLIIMNFSQFATLLAVVLASYCQLVSSEETEDETIVRPSAENSLQVLSKSAIREAAEGCQGPSGWSGYCGGGVYYGLLDSGPKKGTCWKQCTNGGSTWCYAKMKYTGKFGRVKQYVPKELRKSPKAAGKWCYEMSTGKCLEVSLCMGNWLGRH